MPHTAVINPSRDQQMVRSISRIKRLRLSIERASTTGNEEKLASLQAELDRRMEGVTAFKAELDSL